MFDLAQQLAKKGYNQKVEQRCKLTNMLLGNMQSTDDSSSRHVLIPSSRLILLFLDTGQCDLFHNKTTGKKFMRIS